jgi:demethylmenaquinone methyltransferase/2-methoxy-6-polyprenyl-1,4-benzoquinol methylase
MTVVPYKDQSTSKKEQVAQMFNNISPKYDLLNRVLSMGIDISWRKKAIKMLEQEQPKFILDVATGTADFAIEALSLKPEKIIGVDISEGMLNLGKEKIKKMNLTNKIELQMGDSERLLFTDETFDAVIVSFGVRNFENLEKGLQDIYRVLKKGGTLVVLEFSQPQGFIFSNLYNFYSKNILPTIGKLVSKDTAAYTYLPDSVRAFPFGNNFLKVMNNVGFTQTQYKELTFGISSIYKGKK